MRPALLSLFLTACASGQLTLDDGLGDDDTSPTDSGSEDTAKDSPKPTDTGETGDTGEIDTGEVDPRYDSAELRVVAPAAGSIHLIRDGIPLNARVVDANGQVLPFDAITFEIGGDTIDGPQGRANPDPGIYDLRVSADLPNGDRLRTTVGGVRLQSNLTGVWTGTVGITTTTEVQGTPISSTCGGSLTFEVDFDGEGFAGDGSCLLNLPLVGNIPVTYDVDGTFGPNNSAGGTVYLDMVVTQVPLPWEGGLSQGVLSGTFGDDLSVATVDGTLRAQRVSPYIQP